MTFKGAVDVATPKLYELYQITCADGDIYRFTSFERDVVFGDNTYSACGVRRSGSGREATMKIGSINVSIGLGDVSRAIVDLSDIRHRRKLDHATFILYQVDRTNAANYRTCFSGEIAGVEISEEMVSLDIKDSFYGLKRTIPKYIYCVSCNLIFGSTACGVNLAAYKVTGVADAGSDADTLVDAARDEAVDYFNKGILKMTSGANSGLRRPINIYVVGRINILIPFPFAIVAGDGYELWPHCQKQFEKCRDVYNNGDNFFGFKYVPRPEQFK